MMVLVQNKYKKTLVGVLRTQTTFCVLRTQTTFVTLRTQVIRLNSGNLGPQKTNEGVFIIILALLEIFGVEYTVVINFAINW